MRTPVFSTRTWRVVYTTAVTITVVGAPASNDRDDFDRHHPVPVIFSDARPAPELRIPDARSLPVPTNVSLLPPSLSRPGAWTPPVALPSIGPTSSAARAAAYGQLPLAFERNVGQTDARVQFLSHGNGYTFFVTADAAVLSLQTSAPRARRTSPAGASMEARSAVTVRLQFLGANREAHIEPSDPLSSVTNYFTGDDPSRWHAGVPNYARVRQRDLYPGIDVVYYGNQRQLEYDFLVAPGADPGLIALNIEGADGLEIDGDGNLIVDLPDGRMSLKKPFAYQEGEGRGGAVREIPVAYVIENTREVRFAAAAYDHDKKLVIDPVLVYGTYLGGTGLDVATGLAVDSAGNAYVSGITGSVDFPITAGAFQSANGGGIGNVLGLPTDAFVAKMNPAGSALIYSTYLGGSNDDFAFGIAVDAAGNPYVHGPTSSTNFPTTAGAYQTTYGGGELDVFVTKLNASGGLVYSTYIGGGCGDAGWSIAVDASGSAYVTGSSHMGDGCSQTYPITPGAFQGTYGPGGEDVFVTKLNPAGSALVYSTYLAGSVGGGMFSPPDAWARGIAVDAAGNAYVTGATQATDFPTTPGAFRTTLSNNGFCTASYHAGDTCTDAFVTKLNSTGTALLYSTLIGGSDNEEANGIAIDATGNAYVTGYTESSNFPTTAGAYQTTKRGGTDAFVAKLSPTGTALVRSTLLGGAAGVSGSHNASSQAQAIAVDSFGNVYVTGHTRASDFPTTPGTMQTTYAGGSTTGDFFCENGHCDGYFTKFNSGLSGLLYSTYLGGSGDDSPGAIWVDADANVYLAGLTSSSNFPTTAGALQPAMAPGGVSGKWDGPAVSNLPCGDCHITLFLQRQGGSVVGTWGDGGGTLQGVQTSQSAGTFTYAVTSPIDDAPSSCPNPGMTGTMTVDTINNTLDAQFSGINSDCVLETDTWTLDRIGELASGFIVKLNVPSGLRAAADFDGDGKTDVTVFRPSSGHWFVLKSSTNFTTWDVRQWGGGGDVAVRGDYDGDGLNDITVYRPSDGNWFILQSSTNYTAWEIHQWGGTGDVPLAGDFDGDGKADITVYRPSSGHWFILKSSTNYTAWDVRQWGGGGDVPVPDDYDGDGKMDVTVYRPSDGNWFILQSSTNFTTFLVHQWGGGGDRPLSGDFDGDGKSDITVYRPSDGNWFILQSSTNFGTWDVHQWGGAGDIPVPGDYDGDGKTDVAVYRPSDGNWFILQSSTAFTTFEIHQWGGSGDVPAVR